MPKSKSTHARRPASHKPGEHTASPAERMQAILKGYQQHAFVVSSNPLTRDMTPQEALGACRELTESLFRDAFQRDGKQYIYLMLAYALKDLELQMEPLFDCARDVAGVQS